MGFKKMFLGEKMPDKNDPKFRERYESTKRAGEKFARTLRLDKAGGFIQRWAVTHPRAFFTITIGTIVFLLLLNAYQLFTAYNYHTMGHPDAIERQREALQLKRHHGTLAPTDKQIPPARNDNDSK